MTESNPRAGILEAARKLQEQKMLAVERLVDSRSRIDTIAAQLTDAQREDANAYKMAQDAGWSEQELKAVGIDPPARPLPGRPRKAKGKAGPFQGVAPETREMLSGLAAAQLRREAEASTRLDGETHVVGGPGEEGSTER